MPGLEESKREYFQGEKKGLAYNGQMQRGRVNGIKFVKGCPGGRLVTLIQRQEVGERHSRRRRQTSPNRQKDDISLDMVVA